MRHLLQRIIPLIIYRFFAKIANQLAPIEAVPRGINCHYNKALFPAFVGKSFIMTQIKQDSTRKYCYLNEMPELFNEIPIYHDV